ncbi:hypothetical protein AR689_07490 [Arthrobacter sp. EpRS71]|nr:hypothetical protein AR689_07490 [Arthrobacter sp. EpRS71]
MLIQAIGDHIGHHTSAQTITRHCGSPLRTRTEEFIHGLLDRSLPHTKPKLFHDLTSSLAGFGKGADFIEIVVASWHI